MKRTLEDSMKKLFNPEFLNRIDESIVFHSLTKDHIKQIIDISTKKLFDRLGHMGLTLEFTPDAKEFLADKGFDPNYGARPLRRALQNFIEDPLAEEILKGRFPEGSTILVSLREDREGFDFANTTDDGAGNAPDAAEPTVVDETPGSTENGDNSPE